MAQFLIAQWDYAAEGEFELSFQQGDRIKLLEKHNDDWWEGELNDTIGFFPANRTKLEQSSSSLLVDTDPSPTMATTSALSPTSQLNQRSIDHTSLTSPPPLPLSSSATSRPLSVSKNDISPELPSGWSFAYDDEGTIYYFHEQTGESRWDQPVQQQPLSLPQQQQQQQPPNTPPPPPRTSSTQASTLISPPPTGQQEDLELEHAFNLLDPEALKKLALERLDTDGIRYQGYVQMKMVSGGGKLSSWKVYYAVLLEGFLLLYKEAHVKYRKKMATIPPVGSFDLDGCQIDPAGKQDTKRKHAFLVIIPPPRQQVTLYIQTANDKECAAWLDAIMREMIRRKEGQAQDSDTLQLLHALTLDDKKMKINKKMTRGIEDENKQETIINAEGRPAKKLGWFSGAGGGTSRNAKSQGSRGVRTIHGQVGTSGGSSSNGKPDIFGGFLYLTQDQQVPLVVRQCIGQVEARGLESVGIYRLSGPASIIQKYRTAYNRHEPVDLTEEHDINVSTGLLKLYFRELKNPLLTFEYYDWFIDAARITDYDERMYQIKSIIHVLPKENYTVLEYLMRHLHRISLHSDINKMETSNLALIFSVGLLRTPQDDMTSIMHTDLQSKTVEAIIQQVDWFFEVDDNEDSGDVE